LLHIKTFANQVQNYVQGFTDVTEHDRKVLREKWESSEAQNDDEYGYMDGWGVSSDPLDPFANILYTLPKSTKPPKVDPYGEPIGVTPCLIKVHIFLWNFSVLDCPCS
jgi:hypothetical protein